MIRDRSFEQNIITFISMPQTATAANGDSRRILSIFLYILKYFQIQTVHKCFKIILGQFFIFSFPDSLTISIKHQEIYNPLKFP